MNARPAARGHRELAHTADVIIESWAPSLVGALEEAVLACAESAAELGGVVARAHREVRLPHRSPSEDLVRVLEEVLYALDAEGLVPCSVEIALSGGELSCSFGLAEVEDAVPTGVVPKGVSYSELAVVERDGTWRCHAILDV